MGDAVVVYRTEAGRPVVMGAYCPHMGAHLGFGGRVVGERIRCPMHGFEFDPSGRCVRTGYATRPPPTCESRTWPTVEVHGAVFAWHDPAGKPPWFELPSLEYDGWTDLRTHVFERLPSHPQETTENSVDVGHFGAVHRYRNVSVKTPLSLDGAHLSTGYHFERRGLFPGAPTASVDFAVHVHGLGFSFVDVAISSYGLLSRNLVLPTPTDGDHIDLRVGLRLKGAAGPLRATPPRLLDLVMGKLALRTYVADVAQDYDIWANKRYADPAALADGDGPIGKYRVGSAVLSRRIDRGLSPPRRTCARGETPRGSSAPSRGRDAVSPEVNGLSGRRGRAWNPRISAGPAAWTT